MPDLFSVNFVSTLLSWKQFVGNDHKFKRYLIDFKSLIFKHSILLSGMFTGTFRFTGMTYCFVKYVIEFTNKSN